ncbi:hypothetical protein [Streptomyces sp. NPDC002054]|uniref:hypothetical protein n=1 Tax=Streptomyces sp. NPDC002054 TaxID=3154663 RepID=UPI0033211310
MRRALCAVCDEDEKEAVVALTRTGPLEDRHRSTAAPAAVPVAPPALPRRRPDAGQWPRLTVLADPASGPDAAPAAADGPPRAPRTETALRAVHLEALLADPRDAANPYGFQALAAGPRDGTDLVDAELRAAVRAELLPAAAGGNFTTPERLVRVLRPLLRRDLALGHGHAVRELPGTAAAGSKVTALLGPAALTAAAGTVLRGTVRLVADRSPAGRSPADPGIRRWRAPLAAVFADLLACDSLVTVGLRATELPRGSGAAIRAAAGYAVPLVVADALDELGLVLDECGHPGAAAERRVLAKLRADLPVAGAGRADLAARQADLVRELPALAAAFAQHRGPAGPPAATGCALFRLGEDLPHRSPYPEAGGDQTLMFALTAAHDRFTRIAAAADIGAGEPVTPALTRIAGRLLSEQRALVRKSRASGAADPAGPAVRALADRQALVLLAAAVLGVQGSTASAEELPEPAYDPAVRFLGAPHWALLAAGRITERLGIAPDGPGGPAAVEARERLWTELDSRDRWGADCDVHATGVLW